MSNKNTQILYEIEPTAFIESLKSIIEITIRDELKRFEGKNNLAPELVTAGFKSPPYLTIKAVCQLLNISRPTLDSLVAAGVIKKYKIKSSRRVLFAFDEIKSLMEAAKTK